MVESLSQKQASVIGTIKYQSLPNGNLLVRTNLMKTKALEVKRDLTVIYVVQVAGLRVTEASLKQTVKIISKVYAQTEAVGQGSSFRSVNIRVLLAGAHCEEVQLGSIAGQKTIMQISSEDGLKLLRSQRVDVKQVNAKISAIFSELRSQYVAICCFRFDDIKYWLSDLCAKALKNDLIT